MKFVQLILRKIIKIVASRRQILRLKCTKFDFGWGSAPDPAEGAYTVLPRPPADFRGLLLRGGRGGDEREAGRRREGRGGLSGNVAEEAFCLKSAPGPGYDIENAATQSAGSNDSSTACAEQNMELGRHS